MAEYQSKFKMRTVLISLFLVVSVTCSAQEAGQVAPPSSAILMTPPVTKPSQLPLDSVSPKGYTPDEELIYRINFGRTDDVKLLLDKGADPNARTKQGDPVLNVAIDRNDKEAVGMVKALLDKGADPNQPDREHNYPIVSATKNGQTEMVAALIDKGADFQAKSSTGTSILDLAKLNGNPELVKIIQAEIDKENKYAKDARTPARYRIILTDYGLDNCLYQYWQFFLTARQDPARDEEAKKKMAKNKTAINLLIKQIQRYYPFTTTANLENIATPAVQEIYDELTRMISNSNRFEHGVGKEGDDMERCQKIVEEMKLNISVPAGYLASSPAAAP